MQQQRQALPQHPLSGSAQGRGRLTPGLAFTTSPPPQWPSPANSAPTSVPGPSPPAAWEDATAQFVQLAALLHRLHACGRSRQLQPCSAAWAAAATGAGGGTPGSNSNSNASAAAGAPLSRFSSGAKPCKQQQQQQQQQGGGGGMGQGTGQLSPSSGGVLGDGRSGQVSPGGGGDGGVRAALHGLDLPPMLRDLLLDAAVAPLLPLGWGLPLLLAHAKLHCIRCVEV